MSKPVVIYWPNADTQIVSRQAVVAQNSNFPIPGGIFEYDGLIRSVNIVSTDDLTIPGVQYVISGIGCTADTVSTANVVIPTSPLGPITETVNAAAPNVAAQSVNIYESISSIKVLNANATNVEIDYGQFGITQYLAFDYNRDCLPLFTTSLQFISNVGLWGSIYFSLNRPESPDTNGNLVPFGTINGTNVLPPGTFIPAYQLLAPTHANSIALFPGPPITYSVMWASVTNCTTDSMFFTFIQQGSR